MTTQTGLRSSTRTALEIPIAIRGKDANGQPFREAACTLVVSIHGVFIATSRKLVKDSPIVIENPAVSRTATVQVVWMPDRRYPGTPLEVGVKVEGAAYLWPIEFDASTCRGNGHRQRLPLSREIPR